MSLRTQLNINMNIRIRRGINQFFTCRETQKPIIIQYVRSDAKFLIMPLMYDWFLNRHELRDRIIRLRLSSAHTRLILRGGQNRVRTPKQTKVAAAITQPPNAPSSTSTHNQVTSYFDILKHCAPTTTTANTNPRINHISFC